MPNERWPDRSVPAGFATKSTANRPSRQESAELGLQPVAQVPSRLFFIGTDLRVQGSAPADRAHGPCHCCGTMLAWRATCCQRPPCFIHTAVKRRCSDFPALGIRPPQVTVSLPATITVSP